MALKLKVRTKIPAALLNGTGIGITKDGLAYTIGLDYSQLQETDTFDPNFVEVAIWNPHTNEWARVSLTNFLNGSLTPAAFDSVSPTTTRGDLIYRNATTNTRLPAGTAGYHLQTNGAGADPSWSGFTQSGTGTVTRTWQSKARETISVTDFTSVDPTGAADSTAGIQAAVNAAAGKALYFPPGNYKITSAIIILSALTIYADRKRVNILLGTQNQNGFVIGDGTTPTRTATFNTAIININFNPLSGVAASTSGSCIFLNYVSACDIIGCVFFGSDGATKLFNGITGSQATEVTVDHCGFQSLGGKGVATSGGATHATLSSDWRIDFPEFTGITGDCVYFGPGTAGMTVNFPIIFSCSAWGVNMDAPLDGVGGGNNIFIIQPDIQIDGSGGVRVTRGSSVQVLGGWIGGGTVSSAPAFQVDAAAGSSSINGVRIDVAKIVLNGAACDVLNCEVTGDNSTTPTGIAVSSTATDTLISGNRIRQWITAGVAFSGNPAHCAVVGNIFRNNAANITGDAFNPTLRPPRIGDNQTDGSYGLAAASALTLRHGIGLYQVTGATAITSATLMAAETRVVFQAGSGGITINNGNPGFVLKGGVNVAVPAFSFIEFICDGTLWVELSRNF